MIYCSKVKDLAAKYEKIRKTRPDGNCFFRAFAFAYLEYLVRHNEEYDTFRKLAQDSKEKLVSLGFPEFTLEDFHVTVSLYIFYKGSGVIICRPIKVVSETKKIVLTILNKSGHTTF